MGELPGLVEANMPTRLPDCWIVVVVVTSQRPAFLDCAEAKIAVEKKKHPIVSQAFVLRIVSPVPILSKSRSERSPVHVCSPELCSATSLEESATVE